MQVTAQVAAVSVCQGSVCTASSVVTGCVQQTVFSTNATSCLLKLYRFS